MKKNAFITLAKDAIIAFAAWGRKEYPDICAEMERLCDFTFFTTEDLEKFLFD